MNPARRELTVTGDTVRTDATATPLAGRQRFEELYREAAAIEAEDARQAGTLGYVPHYLVNACLPYREVKGSPSTWSKRNGSVSLVLQAGWYVRRVPVVGPNGAVVHQEVPTCIGYPFGVWPRLILSWVATEVVRRRTRELDLGPSMSRFLVELGKGRAKGGQTGNIKPLKEQLKRLFASTITVHDERQEGARDSVTNAGFRIADGSHIVTWWNPLDGNQMPLWSSTVRLSEQFYESIVQSPVPVDMRIVRALARSALAIDLYFMLTYRFAILRRPVTISWEALMAQFGSCSSRRKFIENFHRALQHVTTVYPAARVQTGRAGLVLAPSPPSVPRQPSQPWS